MKVHRQGDVGLTLVPKDEEPEDGETNLKSWGVNEGDGVLAEGEVTGHAHRLAGDYQHLTGHQVHGDGLVKIGESGAVLEHEEHGTMTKLLPGRWYRVTRQREFADQRSRRVAD